MKKGTTFKLGRETIINAILILSALILLFTPMGFYAKVYLNQFLSGSPDVLQEQKQLVLNDFEWRLVDINGNPMDLEQHKGKVVVINLWATWCPPCVAEMPSFQKLHEDYGEKVEFLFVAEDDPIKVTAFLERKRYTLPVYYAQSAIPDILVSKSIPTTYVVDKQGKVVIKEVGAADWNNKGMREFLDRLLAE